MRKLLYLATGVYAGAITMFGSDAQYPSSFFLGCLILLVPMHAILFQLVEWAGPVDTNVLSIIQDVLAFNIFCCVMIGSVIFALRSLGGIQYFGLDVRSVFKGFATGIAYAMVGYFCCLKQSPKGSQDLLALALLPFAFIAAWAVGMFAFILLAFKMY